MSIALKKKILEKKILENLIKVNYCKSKIFRFVYHDWCKGEHNEYGYDEFYAY